MEKEMGKEENIMIMEIFYLMDNILMENGKEKELNIIKMVI